MPATHPIADDSSSISGRSHRMRLFLPPLQACAWVPVVATPIGVAS